MRKYEKSVFEAPLRSFGNSKKLVSSFSFFEAKACGAEPVWIEEVEINLKFLK
jgi:hypothetical protein